MFVQSTGSPQAGSPRVLLGAGGLCCSAWELVAPGSEPLISRAILGDVEVARRALQVSLIPLSLLGVGLCLPAAAHICLPRLSRNGKPFRGWFTSFLGFVPCVSWLQAGQALLPGTCGCTHRQLLLPPSLPFIPTSISTSDHGGV